MTEGEEAENAYTVVEETPQGSQRKKIEKRMALGAVEMTSSKAPVFSKQSICPD